MRNIEFSEYFSIFLVIFTGGLPVLIRRVKKLSHQKPLASTKFQNFKIICWREKKLTREDFDGRGIFAQIGHIKLKWNLVLRERLWLMSIRPMSHLYNEYGVNFWQIANIKENVLVLNSILHVYIFQYSTSYSLYYVIRNLNITQKLVVLHQLHGG